MGTSPILSTLSFRISKLVMLMIIQGDDRCLRSRLSLALCCAATVHFSRGGLLIRAYVDFRGIDFLILNRRHFPPQRMMCP